MTLWTARTGEILDATADVLICSANPQLNLSGGVGGAFRLRYGDSMQEFLHGWLVDQGKRFLAPGSVVVAPACGSPFRAIVHAVAIDAFYDTSSELIRETYAKAFAAVADKGLQTVASACLACGYGRASPETFLAGVRDFLGHPLPSITRVDFVSTNADIVDVMQAVIARR